MDRKLIFFDLETTGVDTVNDEIIQIAAVAVDGDLTPVEEWEVKIRPSTAGRKKLEEAKAAGFDSVYDPQVWAQNSMECRHAINAFASWLSHYPFNRNISKKGHSYWTAQLVGHNGAKFDGPFLFQVAKDLGVFIPASYLVLDTVQLSLWASLLRPTYKPPAHNLGALCEHLDVELLRAHDALEDVYATIGVAKQLLGRMLHDKEGDHVEGKEEVRTARG